MCHLDIVNYLYCGHWRYDLAHCGFRGHALCVKKTTDGAVDDVCPQCRIFSTPERLKELRRSGSQFCKDLPLAEQRPGSGRVQRPKTNGNQWKAYCPPDEPSLTATAPSKPVGYLRSRQGSAARISKHSQQQA